jgi:hypothetical protein
MNARIMALRPNKRGSIEGLPLYFLVSAVVVAVAMSALLSMMGGMQGQTLGSVETDRDAVAVNTAVSTLTFNVTVKDTSGKPIEGATVVVEGLGASAAKKTDAAGKVKVTVSVDLGNANFGELDVKASYHGPVGESSRGTTVLVSRA